MQENAADGAVSSLHPCSSLSVFAFRMPVLPAGDYVVAAAVAEGTQSEHEQLHWIHDALAFHSLPLASARTLWACRCCR